MHRSQTFDYVLIIEGELELTLDSGEKRIMKPGDVKTEFARFGAVTLGIEGAKLNE